MKKFYNLDKMKFLESYSLTRLIRKIQKMSIDELFLGILNQ